ncbi:hypothetical protein [Gallaecimonas mangrovi]|uniref:hypothetical protein n=1 Tax=Gallaecimonas mangrovi TaxID=2291597 RepID=UPI000E1FFEA2|nr:hypothetical protein [Gallaecimonas mangrovi]
MVNEEIERKIQSAPSILEWKIIVPYHTEKVRRLMTLFIFLVFFTILIVTGYVYKDLVGITFLAVTTILMSWIMYFVIMANYLYSYKFTKYGYVYEHYQQVPRIMHYIAHFVMATGGIVAIVGFIVVGPKAFIGGGIFLLIGLASGKKNMIPSPKITYKDFKDGEEYFIFDIQDENKIIIISNPFNFRNYHSINVDSNVKYKVNKEIEKLAKNCKYYKSNSFIEACNHPKYREAINSANQQLQN